MTRLFKRHRVRATFYHIGFVLFVILTIIYRKTIDFTDPYLLFTMGLIVVDYIAEMYDPHPDLPGPFFKRHFHRFFDDSEDDK